MEPQNETPQTDAPVPQDEAQEHPVDALSRTPDELKEEHDSQVAAEPALASANATPVKKQSNFIRIFRKINFYFLIFCLLVIVAIITTVVNYLNSQKTPPAPEIASQSLTADALKQLANTDTSVGKASQTLNIQGNAIIAGQTLTRGNLNVAGNFQTSGSIQGASITISGSANLGSTQASELQVAGNAAVQGNMTLRNLNVAGTSSFSGAMTASQITVTNLTMSGNAVLNVPNHISFSSGPTPGIARGTALGNGGSVSLNGSDTSGTISITTGNAAAAGCFATITFRQAFTGQPRITLGPINYGAGVSQAYVGNLSKNSFQICAATPPSNQSFGFDYFVAN